MMPISIMLSVFMSLAMIWVCQRLYTEVCPDILWKCCVLCSEELKPVETQVVTENRLLEQCNATQFQNLYSL